MGPTIPLPLLGVFVASITTSLSNVQRGICEFDILMTALASVRIGQTDMPYREHLLPNGDVLGSNPRHVQ